jgi:hypothetical protein
MILVPPKIAMAPSPVNLSRVPPYCCTTSEHRSNKSDMISRNRSGPIAAAMSIERTTSAKSTVTCLYSATFAAFVRGAPHSSQNFAWSRSSVPQAGQATPVAIG